MSQDPQQDHTTSVGGERPLVLVTGGTGFIAAHCIARLLERGFRVRATARSTASTGKLRDQVERAGQDGSTVEVVAADLGGDQGWAEALAGVTDVLHVASPVAVAEPRNPDDVIRPATEGTLRVLRAAHGAGVRRVVLTSAFGAIGFGWGEHRHLFTEADWAPLDGPGMSTYNKSKTLAEQAAWDFVEHDGDGLELVVMNPVAVFGPVVGGGVSGGNGVIRALVRNRLPVLVDLWFPVVDVRDVAAAHVAALEVPEAAGQRFIVASGEGLTMRQIAQLLHDELDPSIRVPRATVPNGLVKALAKVLPAARELASEVGHDKQIDDSRARIVLGLAPRPAAEAILASGRSIKERGLA